MSWYRIGTGDFRVSIPRFHERETGIGHAKAQPETHRGFDANFSRTEIRVKIAEERRFLDLELLKFQNLKNFEKFSKIENFCQGKAFLGES